MSDSRQPKRLPLILPPPPGAVKKEAVIQKDDPNVPSASATSNSSPLKQDQTRLVGKERVFYSGNSISLHYHVR